MSIYVGNLPHSSTEEAVKDLFSQYGEVKSVKIIKDRETGRSRGFAFVDMANSSSAQEAIDNLNGYDFEGRKLQVNEARPREERKDSGFNRNGGGGSRSGGFRRNY